MSKLNVTVQLKTDSGASLGSSINSGDQLSLTAAKAAIQVVIDQRVAAAVANATDLENANNAFNS